MGVGGGGVALENGGMRVKEAEDTHASLSTPWL